MVAMQSSFEAGGSVGERKFTIAIFNFNYRYYSPLHGRHYQELLSTVAYNCENVSPHVILNARNLGVCGSRLGVC